MMSWGEMGVSYLPLVAIRREKAKTHHLASSAGKEVTVGTWEVKEEISGVCGGERADGGIIPFAQTGRSLRLYPKVPEWAIEPEHTTCSKQRNIR